MEKLDHNFLNDPYKYIISKGGHLYFAILNNEVVGTCALYKLEKNKYELIRMAASPPFQGKGIGKKLLSYVIEQAKKIKAKEIVLETSHLLPLQNKEINLRAAVSLTMQQFFAYVKDNYISDHYAFFISGHGEGWYYKNYSAKIISASIKNSNESKDSIDPINLKKALLYNKPDVLSLDICLMADLETIFQLKSEKSALKVSTANSTILLGSARSGSELPPSFAKRTFTLRLCIIGTI